MASSSRTRRLVGLSIFLGALVLAVAGGLYVLGHQMSAGRLAKNTTIAGVAVGGLTPDSAQQRLRHALTSAVSRPISIKAGDKSAKATPAQLGLSVDYAASVAKADAGPEWNPVTILTVLFGGGESQLVVTSDDVAVADFVASLAKQVDQPATDAAVTYAGLTPTVTTSGYTADLTTQLPSATTAQATRIARGTAKQAVAAGIQLTVGDRGTIEMTPQMIAACLSFTVRSGELAPVFDTTQLDAQLTGPLAELGLSQPENARYLIVDGTPRLSPAVEGEGLDLDALATDLARVVVKPTGRSVTAAVAQRSAEFSTAATQALGITEVTGEFTTSFPGTDYRYHNIGKAAKLINNSLLRPGEVFSMNATLGERTAADGWMVGEAIDAGRIVQRVGGGVSQAATTTFNAIFFAGLEDVSHKPPSLYFDRYPPGREATLDWQSVDLKFRNDSPYGVLLQAWVTGKPGSTGTITVRVWSTKRYTIKATQPVLSNYRSPGATIHDSSDACVPQSASRGFDVSFDRLFYLSGKLVRTEPFRWTYNASTPVVCS